MDTTKLIEEAGRWAGRLRAGPVKDEASARLLDYLAAAARRQAQENAEHALDIARDRDAARAELEAERRKGCSDG